jgi:hypothetical protein
LPPEDFVCEIKLPELCPCTLKCEPLA